MQKTKYLRALEHEQKQVDFAKESKTVGSKLAQSEFPGVFLGDHD